MRFPARHRPRKGWPVHRRAVAADELEKDRIIDELLATAGALVEELRESLSVAQEAGREVTEGGDDDHGR